jgi:hypothetical protein
MMEHGPGALGSAYLNAGRNPLDRQRGFMPEPCGHCQFARVGFLARRQIGFLPAQAPKLLRNDAVAFLFGGFPAGFSGMTDGKFTPMAAVWWATVP